MKQSQPPLLLISMLGYPGSGKSYFARGLAKYIGAVRLNSDLMRAHLFKDPDAHRGKKANHLVFGAFDYATAEILNSGYSVIYDANCNHIAERQKNARIAEVSNALPVVVWVQTSVTIASQRVVTRETTAEQPRLTKEVVLRHMQRLETPTEEELCIIIDGTVSQADQLASFTSQLSKILNNYLLK